MCPSHDIHEEIDEMFLGESHPDVHDYLDVTVKSSGSHHREDPIHSLDAAVSYAALNQDPDKLNSAVLHFITDDFFTPELEEAFKMMKKMESFHE